MKDVLIGIAVGLTIIIVGFVLLYPYYCLVKLNDIADDLEKIRKAIEDKKVTEVGSI